MIKEGEKENKKKMSQWKRKETLNYDKRNKPKAKVKQSINNSFEYWFLKIPGTNPPYPGDFSCKRFYIYATNNKKYLDFVAGVSACTLGHQPASKPGYQRSVGQVFACYGTENSQSQLWILQAFSITTTGIITKPILLTRRLSKGVKIRTRYRSKSIDFLPQCLSWKHHGFWVMGFEERKNFFAH
jgi:hypothetical protein